MKKWEQGQFLELIKECEAIQSRLTKKTRKPEEVQTVFVRLMLLGKLLPPSDGLLLIIPEP